MGYSQFRGRATQIHVFPLSFAEFNSAVGGDERKALDTYMIYGGMPRLLTLDDEKVSDSVSVYRIPPDPPMRYPVPDASPEFVR